MTAFAKEDFFLTTIQLDDFRPELPLILNIPTSQKLLLSLMLTVTLFVGLSLRCCIISFIGSGESKLCSINILLLLEQVNALPLMLQIIFSTTALNLNSPLSKFLGRTIFYVYLCTLKQILASVTYFSIRIQ